jgi:hypothetical protein
MKDRLLFRAIIILALSVVFLAHLGCSGTSFMLLDSGELKGIVTDARSGANLDGVYVEAYSDWYYDDDWDYDYTSGDGSYSLYLEGGYYDVRFEKSGYSTKVVGDVYVTSPFSRSLDVQLTPTGDPSPTGSPSPSPSALGSLYASRSSQGAIDPYIVISDGQMGEDPAGPISLSSQAVAMAEVTGKSRLYAALAPGGPGSVESFDTVGGYAQAGSTIALQSNEGSPFDMVHYAGGDILFVSRAGSGAITGHGIIERIDLSGDDPVSKTLVSLSHRDPRKMALGQAGGILFAACRGGGHVAAYDVNSGTQWASPAVVADPAGLAFHPSQGRLYVISGSGAFIKTFDVSQAGSFQDLGGTAGPGPLGTELLSAALDTQLNRLFTLEKSGTLYTLRAWNVNGDPPYAQVSDPVSWSGQEGTDLLYYQPGRLLFVSLRNSSGSGGIRVYDCGTYPAGQMLAVDGSPFSPGIGYIRLED